MAEITGLGERSADVIRICGRLIIFQMASNTSSTGDVVVIAEVAVGALPRRHGVAAGQGKSDGAMIELGVEPVIRSVATLAGGGKLGDDVVRAAGCLEIRCVTGKASRGHGLKLAGGRPLVAGIAVYRRVRPDEGKAVHMLLNLLDGDLPAANRVAPFAVRTQLPPVNIRVAVLASLSDICEHWLDVALGAVHRLVHAA